jgi:hypothetical protein
MKFGNVQDVMDGNIDGFIEEYLKKNSKIDKEEV